MFFVNVQSCSVLNACYLWIRYFVIQSRFLSTMPPFSCRQFFMIFVTRTSIFAWVNTTILLLCINRQLKCCNPAVVRLLTLPKIPAFWHQALAYSAAQIVAHHFVFWHDSLLLVDRHSPLTIRPYTSGRLTVPSEPSSIANTAIILTIDIAAFSGRHTRQRHMPCRPPTTPSRLLPPSALQPRLHGASHHFKDSEHHHRVEHHFTPPTRSSSSASSSARERPFRRFLCIVHVLR